VHSFETMSVMVLLIPGRERTLKMIRASSSSIVALESLTTKSYTPYTMETSSTPGKAAQFVSYIAFPADITADQDDRRRHAHQFRAPSK